MNTRTVQWGNSREIVDLTRYGIFILCLQLTTARTVNQSSRTKPPQAPSATLLWSLQELSILIAFHSLCGHHGRSCIVRRSCWLASRNVSLRTSNLTTARTESTETDKRDIPTESSKLPGKDHRLTPKTDRQRNLLPLPQPHQGPHPRNGSSQLFRARYLPTRPSGHEAESNQGHGRHPDVALQS